MTEFSEVRRAPVQHL